MVTPGEGSWSLNSKRWVFLHKVAGVKRPTSLLEDPDPLLRDHLAPRASETDEARDFHWTGSHGQELLVTGIPRLFVLGLKG
jgi:hypothetical protein